MPDLYFYRDPEAELEAKEEEEAKGVDEVGAAAVDQGFVNTGDWEVSGASAGAFAAANATTGDAAAAGGWEAAPAVAPTAEWGATVDTAAQW